MTVAGSGPSVMPVIWEAGQAECLSGVDARIAVRPVGSREADGVQAAQQQAQQCQAGRVGPLQVIGHDQAARPGRGREETDRALQGQRAAGLLIQAVDGGAGRYREAGHHLGQRSGFRLRQDRRRRRQQSGGLA